MTDLMQLLYDHTLATAFTARLNTPDYHQLEALEDRLSARLRQQLAGDTWDTLGKYQEALSQQRDAELEAMFLASFSLARELG